MELRQLQRDILSGIETGVDPAQVRAAEDKLFTHRPSPFYGKNRRINRFMVGADPEFMFESADGPVYAAGIGLRPGLAFGSDQNDRLVELRPAPSRSTVDVLASILAELRWLYRVHAQSQNFAWRAGAFAHGDGMGGHVHFGRKRPQRTAEVAGLDGLAKTMRRAGLFPHREWTQRTQGDARRQIYGLYGDIRPQKHGYEYRTLPSWLDSPTLAFLVLTLSKLVVVDPDITSRWNEQTPRSAWALLVGLARFYKGRDDDAWMLYSLMNNFERFIWRGGDFRARWGLSSELQATHGNFVYPEVIRGTDEDREDILNHLLQNTPIPARNTFPNFRHTIPSGYRWILPHFNPGRQPGVGEVLHDLVTTRNEPRTNFSLDCDANVLIVRYPVTYRRAASLNIALNRMTAGRMIAHSQQGNGFSFSVYMGRDWRKPPYLEGLRAFLKSGLLPLWTVADVIPDSAARWNTQHLFTETAIRSIEDVLAGGR